MELKGLVSRLSKSPFDTVANRAFGRNGAWRCEDRKL